ncbi:MAG: hypothetical protein WCJ58_08205 [bacterium]
MKQLKPLGQRGLFIVLYGPNNIGKSVQIRELSSRIIQTGKLVMSAKYPIYHLGKTGPKIDTILRRPYRLKRKYSELELQKLFAENRQEFQDIVIEILNHGINLIAEDYTGTGIAWGMTREIPLETLEKINANLIKPDLAILLAGKRFASGKEAGHRNEDDSDSIWKKNCEIHYQLGKKYNWITVNANQDIPQVHAEIWKIVVPMLNMEKSTQFPILFKK